MASVSFYLRSKKTDPAALIGRLYYNGKEFVFSTGYSVSPKNWNQKAQRVTARERAADDINTALQQKASEILKIHDDLKRENRLTNDNIRQSLSGEKIKGFTLFEHIERVLEDIKIKEDRNIKEGRQKKKYIYYRYRVCAQRLKEFAHKRNLDFSDIDLNFYNKYVEFLRSIPLAENSIGGEIKRLKRFLKLAEIQGINTNFIYRSTEFKAPDIKKKHVTLSEEEVNFLFNMELSGYLDKARDLFIIGCRTGLRVSDYGKCVSDVVEESGLICIDETDKTGEPVYVPIHWQVKAILDKYKGLPPVISDQKLNTYIKELCKKAVFTQRVKDTREGLNRPKNGDGFCLKYELITTHTARRSCATNMYLAGFDLYFIQGVLGHTKIEQTVRYLGITRKLAAQKLANHKYFKKP